MNCIQMMVLMICLAWGICQGDWKCEADEFLQRMPQGLQDSQARAVRQARLGDNAALKNVRNSRNGRNLMPKTVIAEELQGGHRLYRPVSAVSKLPLLVYFHGGGWAFGSVNSCARFCADLCAKAQVLVLGVNYRLAPECPYPLPLKDCVNAVTLARKNLERWGGSPDKLFLGGDSAGGNLALATAMKLQGQAQVRGLVLFYPVVKAWNDQSESWQTFQRGYGLDGWLMEEFNRAYCGNASPSLPEISPACASDEVLRHLPSILQVNAERDILRDQGRNFVAKLKALGVSVKHHELKGTVHLFITVKGQEGAFQEAVRLTGDFLRRP